MKQARDYRKEYNSRNKERIKATTKKYREKNKEKIKAYQKQYYANLKAGNPTRQKSEKSANFHYEKRATAAAETMRQEHIRTGKTHLIKSIPSIPVMVRKLKELDANYKPKYDELMRLNPR